MNIDRPIARGPATLRKSLPFGIGMFALVLSVYLLYPSIHRWSQSETSVDMSMIRTATVTRGELVRDVSAQGRVVAAFHPTVFSPSAGIAAITVRAGATVAEGQELCRISSPQVENALKQELSRLHSLEADLSRQRVEAKQVPLRNRQRIDLLAVELEAAKRAQNRAEQSRALGILTEVEYEKTRDDVLILSRRLEFAEKNATLEQESLAFEIAERKAQLERQRLVVADWQRQVEELILRAPVGGLVSRLHVEDRQAVDRNAPLVTVVDLTAFEVEISVAEAYADELATGTPVRMTIDGQVYEGQLRSISPEVAGNQVKGIVAFAGKTPIGLKQNQRVSTRLVLDSRPDVLKVKRGPFLESGGGRTAYVIDNGLAQARSIQVGVNSISEVEVVSGLEPGETIVISDTGRFEGAQKILLRQ